MIENEAAEYLLALEHVDKATIEMLLMHTQDDRTVLFEIFDAFYPDAEQLISEIQGAVILEKEESLRRAAHSLAGIAGSVGALKLKEAARYVENSIKKGSPRAAFAIAENMDEIYQDFKADIQNFF